MPLATDGVPVEAYAVALASVPGVGPRTLRALLEAATARSAWESLVDGRVRLATSRRAGSATERAREIDVGALWAAHVRAGIGVCLRGSPGYPRVLAADPEAPEVLFFLGNPAVLDSAPRVAIVGTRSATRYGLGVAAQLGCDLAAAGVVVVSGLALGIDGAAHEGAVAAWRTSCSIEPAAEPDAGGAAGRRPASAAPPVGVVAGSVATPYPRQHAGLWRRVAEAGAVLSESPIGVADLGWRFPLRNRIIAAIADVVVVVECHLRGGSLHTVEAAAARAVPVGAVPGSVRSPASAGTNALLADGCFVVRDASDVLVAVGLASEAVASASSASPGHRREQVDRLPAPTAAVIAALGWDPTSLDEILEQTGLALDVVCGALERLRAQGLAEGEGGWWTRK
ncbi:MAG: DNA-processing protein DprA [Actinomycetota bacterium]|nr:DNA-processing protein DprA [Actinomycetota bacterium]